MKIKISWDESPHERSTETDLPINLSWPDLQEHIRLLVKTACKYAEEKYPEGLLRETDLP